MSVTDEVGVRAGTRGPRRYSQVLVTREPIATSRASWSATS